MEQFWAPGGLGSDVSPSLSCIWRNVAAKLRRHEFSLIMARHFSLRLTLDRVRGSITLLPRVLAGLGTREKRLREEILVHAISVNV